MSARTKLNGFIIAGVLVFASLLGLAGNSWLVFAITAVVLAAIMIHAGELRLKPGDGRLGQARHRQSPSRR